MRFQVLQVRHDTLVVGHFGFNKTMELVFHDYWWPQLWKFVKEFMRSCDVCAHAKNLSLPSWTSLAITNPYFTMVFDLHGFHHGSFTI